MDKRILLPNVGNACRCLFGPVDHDEVRKTLHRELKVINERNTARWNFDFTQEKPLPGRWSWEGVEELSVPRAYEMPQLSAKLDVRVCLVPKALEGREEKQEEEGRVELPAGVAPVTAASEDTSETASIVSTACTTATQTSPKKRKRQSVMTGKLIFLSVS